MSVKYKEFLPNQNLYSLTLYTTALCNLNCSYCYICKDNQNSLKKIDNDIKEDWENKNYLKRIQDQLSQQDRNSIQHISLWGGETLIGLPRFTPQFKEFLYYLPRFSSVDFSTNLTLTNSIKLIEDLIDEINNNYNGEKKFRLTIQISVDGPEELNDFNRGKGTTKKILENFNKLLKIKKREKVFLEVTTKPTLSTDSFDLFQTEEDVYNYYNFFEQNFYNAYLKNNVGIDSFFLGVPNYAEPFDYSKEDGIRFAKICELFESVSKQNSFKGFSNRSLLPYVSRYPISLNNLNREYTYSCGGGCGKIIYDCCMIPKNKFSVCHRSLFDSYVEYHNSATGDKIPENEFYDNCTFDLVQFIKLRNAINTIYSSPSKMIPIDTDQMIKLYALAGQIDKKYIYRENRIPVINFMAQVGMCLDANMKLNGSLFTQGFWWIKLFLNGAFDIFIREIRRLN